ncbi:hypothetical protein ABZ678_02950 [Streptomyces hirsutus]|uniref:hypothetical protein n=1 Tax=Streptomyces hirsutus TaxID=35620 RepID=UPI0033E56D39
MPPDPDRHLTAEHWLKSAHRRPEAALQEWERTGMALLPLGTRFSAVRLPSSLVFAVTGGDLPGSHVDQMLEEVLEGGPVICDPGGWRYYALVPPSMPVTWHQAADEWRGDDVECLGRDCYLGVPRTDQTERGPAASASYWSVPMQSAGRLCAPLAVARLIAAALHVLRGRDGQD